MLRRSVVSFDRLELTVIELKSLGAADPVSESRYSAIDTQPPVTDPPLDFASGAEAGICQPFLYAFRQIQWAPLRVLRLLRLPSPFLPEAPRGHQGHR